MTAVCYIFFSYIPARESRYILLLSLPIVCCCFICLQTVFQCLSKFFRTTPKWTRIISLATIAVLFICQARLASKVSVLSVSGYKQLVRFLEKNAPDEPVFYDGKNHGIFTFYIQAGDPDYRRRVILGRKLLYAESLYRRPQEFVSSPQDVVDLLLTSGGCQWVVVNEHPDNERSAAPWHLRKAVKGPQFELVKSFPITKKRASGVKKTRIDVYRILVPIKQVDEVDMPLFSLGEGVRIRIKPIQR
jgi:hypothetical protein